MPNSDLTTAIRDAIDAFDFEQARKLLKEALKEPSAEIYYLASQVALDEVQKNRFLEKSLDLDPFYTPASRDLAPQAPRTKPIVAKAEAPTQLTGDTPEGVVITAITLSGTSVNLYRTPLSDSPLRTTIPAQSRVILLSRTETARWINVIFVGSTNQEILGWMLAQDIENAMVAGHEIRVLDLPITNFEYNSREEVADLISRISRRVNLAVALLVIPPLFGILYMCLGGQWAAASRSTTPFFVVSGLVFFLLGIPGALTYDKIDKELKASLGWSPGTFNSKLQYIKRSKQSLTETQMEHNAMAQALQIGGSMLVKMTPDYKDLTNR